jgi:iron complex outermembrane recepter protein
MTFMNTKSRLSRAILLASFGGILLTAAPSFAQTVQAPAVRYAIVRQPLGDALLEISRLSGAQVVFASSLVNGKFARPVRGSMPTIEALRRAVRGSGLVIVQTAPNTFAVQYQTASIAPPAEENASQRASTPQQQAVVLPSQDVETIIVTGTRVRSRTAFDSSVPVDTVSGTNLRSASAIGDLGEAIEALAPSANLPLLSAVGLADNVRALRLRGLYPDQALVLINGKRRHHTSAVLTSGNYASGTSPVDLNLIPASAIKRIEILRDGAGAQYGSDAISGVVNIILKDGSEGGEAFVSYGAHRTQFEPTSKEISDGETLQVAIDQSFKLGNDGFLRVGASFRDRNPTNRSGFDQVASFEDGRNRTVANLAGKVNFASGNGQATESSLFYNLEVPTGAATIYSFATAATRDSTGTAFYRYPFGNSGLRDEDLATTVFPLGYLPVTRAKGDDISVVLGGKGGPPEANWDVSARYARNNLDFGIENTLNPSLGAASPTAFKTGDFTFEQASLNADTVRSFQLSGFASPLNMAAGLEFRHEAWRSKSGDPKSYEAGPIRTNAIGAQGAIVLRPQDAAKLDRNIASVYVDFDLEVNDRLRLELALRGEDYSDFGSSITGKFSTRLKITDALNLRASVGNGIRAPSLAQQAYGSTDSVFASSGPQILVDRRIFPTTSPISQALGAEPLKPETATNYSLGFAALPLPGLSVSIDAYRIDVADRIQLSGQINSALVRSFIQREFGLTNIDRVQYFANLNETKTEGFDIVASYSVDVGNGRLGLTAAYNYGSTRFTRNDPLPARLAAIDPAINLFTIAGITSLDVQPLSRGIYTIDWEDSKWSVRASATRFGRVLRGSSDATRGRIHEYEGDWSLDLEATRAITDRLSLTIGANNALDAYPEQQFPVDNYFGSLPYDFTVPLGYNGAFFYSKITLKL